MEGMNAADSRGYVREFLDGRRKGSGVAELAGCGRVTLFARTG